MSTDEGRVDSKFGLPTDLSEGLLSDLIELLTSALPPGTRISTRTETEHLHSLNNDIRFAWAPNGRRFLIRLPRESTATALGIDRAAERYALTLVMRSGLTPRLLAASPRGILISDFIQPTDPWTQEDWSDSDRGPLVMGLMRSLLALSVER